MKLVYFSSKTCGFTTTPFRKDEVFLSWYFENTSDFTNKLHPNVNEAHTARDLGKQRKVKILAVIYC